MDDHRLYDITPDKSLVKKLGAVGYRTEQAIAELVDNSIDARTGDVCGRVNVYLDFKGMRIMVEDDGTGMDGTELAGAMTIAKEMHNSEGRLGRFGMGMKSACSALGKRFAITTSKVGSNTEYTTEYDEGSWMSDTEQGWKNLRINEKAISKDGHWHGTKITISSLSVPLYPNQVSNLKESFGIRYSPYIESGQISLHVNTVQCRPTKQQDTEPGSRIGLRIPLSFDRKITGHLELLKKRSIRGNYGLHLFWRGRLIKAFSKFGFPAHPENARIIGSINLDHVPVNYTKSGFLEESKEYAEAIEKFGVSEDLRTMLRLSASVGSSIPSVRSVFEHVMAGTNNDDEKYTLSTRVRTKPSMDAIAATEPFEVEHGGVQVNVEVERAGPDAPLYVADIKENGTRVSINADSGIFRFVKNPFFLMGMIASEAKLLASNPDMASLLGRRNQDMAGLLREKRPSNADAQTSEKKDRRWRMPQAAKQTSRARAIQEPRWRRAFQERHNYGLSPELVDAHDILVEEHDAKFQFTALSTLSPYMHDLGGKLAYTIHTAPTHGEAIVELLAERLGREFVVVDRPSADTIESLFRLPYVKRILAVREYASITGSTVAPPAKAFVDLMAEALSYGIMLDVEDLRRILMAAMRLGVVELGEVRRHARATKRTKHLDELLGEVRRPAA